MKRVTAIIITAAAVIGCSYVGSSHAKTMASDYCREDAANRAAVYVTPNDAMATAEFRREFGEILMTTCEIGRLSMDDKTVAKNLHDMQDSPEFKKTTQDMQVDLLNAFMYGNANTYRDADQVAAEER